MNSLNKIEIVAPARICLFGDHQDYLGLPVIACAINKKIILTAQENRKTFFNISMPDINSERQISISETFNSLKPQDYFAAAIRVVKRFGCQPTKGYDIILKSDIPINAGVSSSSALIVAWVHFLLKAFGCDQAINAPFIAQLAYEAEVLEHNAPGGRMDQYTSAIGNIIYIDTGTAHHFKTIGTSMDGLILAESGIPKETLGVLAHLRTKATKAIEIVSEKIPNFKLKTTTLKDYDLYTSYISEELKPYFYAAIKNHSITQKALQEFEKETIYNEIIGQLMNEHHQVLKNLLKITVPKIDMMIDAAIEAGAYGAKIVGSGGGGSIVALAPQNKKETIIKALFLSGAKTAYGIQVTQGTYSN